MLSEEGQRETKRTKEKQNSALQLPGKESLRRGEMQREDGRSEWGFVRYQGWMERREQGGSCTIGAVQQHIVVDHDTILTLKAFCSFSLPRGIFPHKHAQAYVYILTQEQHPPPYQKWSVSLYWHISGHVITTSCYNSLFLYKPHPPPHPYWGLPRTALYTTWPLETWRASVLIQSNLSAHFGVLCSMTQQERFPDYLATRL